LILGYHFCDSPNTESLTAFLTTLRDAYGIRPQLFTGDDARVYDAVPGQVWPGVAQQLCHFHAMRRLLLEHLRLSLLARVRALKPKKPGRWQFKPLSYKLAKKQYKQDLAEWTELHRKRRLLLKSPHNLLKKNSVARGEAVYVLEVCRQFKTLATLRELVLNVYSVFNSKDAAAADVLRRGLLGKWKGEAERDEHIRNALAKLADDDWFGRLFAFTRFENAQRTTNSTERANRWFRKRQKTHYRNRRAHTITNMLHADLVYRRERAPNEPPTRLREKTAELRQPA
jgi:hypothetical protein